MKTPALVAFGLFVALIGPRIALAAETVATAKAPLELTLEASKRAFKLSDGFPFAIVFHNVNSNVPSSPTDSAAQSSAKAAQNRANNLLLNVGRLLGNGEQVWQGLKGELKTADGQVKPVTLGFRVGGVAGRMYPMTVALRAGGTFRLQVNADDYYVGPGGEKLAPGKYELRISYRAEPFPENLAKDVPRTWEGEVVSIPLNFEVLAE